MKLYPLRPFCFLWTIMLFQTGETAYCETVSPGTQIVFFQKNDHLGRPIELTPGSAFFHLALRVQEGWIHTDPLYGVEVLKSLSDFKKRRVGYPTIVISLPQIKTLSLADYHHFLGRPYDSKFDWSDSRALYCSELIRKLLGWPPAKSKMEFSSKNWKNQKRSRERPGASPQDDFELFSKIGFTLGPCERAFIN